MAASINLKIKTDPEQASRDLKKFGNLSEDVKKQVEAFQKSFKSENVDKFIDKNRRLGAAIEMNKGPMTSALIQQKALQREMESLIKKGLDPQDEAIKNLTKEYDRLNKQVRDGEDAQKGMEAATKGAIKGLQAIAVAAAAAGAAIVASTVDLAKMGDQIAKTSKVIGVSVESLQELSFAAERNGLPANNLSNIFKKLNRNVGDLKAGTGTLTTFLNKSDKALLNQLKSAGDSEEAFNLLVDAIAEAPTQFDKAALSQAAFGRSGQDLIVFAQQGSEEINKLREEARSYGVISENVAALSENFVDSQRNLQQATIGVRAEIAEKLLPVFTRSLNKIADFISSGDEFKNAMEKVGIALAAVTAGLVTFLLITKGTALIIGFANAIRVLNLAFQANPVAFIATVIVTVLVPAIILLIKNWDKVVVFMQTTIAKIHQKFILFGADLKLKWTVAFNAVKIVFLELGKVIVENVLGGVQKLLDLAGKIPFIGDKFKGLSENVDDLKKSFVETTKASQLASAQAIIDAAKEKAAIEKLTTAKLALIEKEKKERLAALEKQEEVNKQSADKQKEDLITLETDKTNIVLTALKERLAVLNNAEAIASQENVATFTEFLNQRANQEQMFGEARIEFFQTELERINELENLSDQERIDATLATEAAITQAEKESSDARIAIKRQELAAVSSIIGSIGDILSIGAKKSRGLAIAQKVLASAQAGINSYLAFTKTLADGGPFPLNVLNAGAVVVSGLAQQAKILSTPIPSAQTGTGLSGIEIPDSGRSTRADQVGVMAGPGEKINVTPRGEGGGGLNVKVDLEGQTLIDFFNDKIQSGDIRITTDNIQTGIAV